MKPAAFTPWAQVEALGASVAELAAFQDEPLQMRSGTVGKTGFLHLGFERRGSRTVLADLDRRSPYMVQRALYCDQTMPDLATVFLITTTGCLLQGDRLALDITLGPHAKAHVTSQSATKIHAMDANYAAQTQTITLADEAYLEFLPDPMIPHRHARFVSDTQITVAPSATLVFSEIIQSGRKHHRPDECFGATAALDIDFRFAPRRPPLIHREAGDRAAAICDASNGRDGFFRRVRQRDPVHAQRQGRSYPGARGGRCRPCRRCGVRRVSAAQRCRPDLQGAGPRNRAGKSQSTRVLGSGARGDDRRRPPASIFLALTGQPRPHGLQLAESTRSRRR